MSLDDYAHGRAAIGRLRPPIALDGPASVDARILVNRTAGALRGAR